MPRQKEPARKKRSARKAAVEMKAADVKARDKERKDDDDEYETVYVLLELPVDASALQGSTSCEISVRAIVLFHARVFFH
jgi:hypothetical protein